MALIAEAARPLRFTDPDVCALNDVILTAYRLQAQATIMIKALEAANQRSASTLEQLRAVQAYRRA